MAFFIGRDREARRAYGFDEIAIVLEAFSFFPEVRHSVFPLAQMILCTGIMAQHNLYANSNFIKYEKCLKELIEIKIKRSKRRSKKR